uniref:Uncharacterized protein n=1 Tax=Physcomitrium patens TaxID=3218 RepID=A0A2K1JEK8_PHYPA|nr:hypothetical protein PHYPA_020208 [Physcomitrium patens]
MVQRHIKAGALVELLFLTDPSRTILLINASASAFNDSVCGSMNVGSCRSHRPLVIRLRRRQPLSAPTMGGLLLCNQARHGIILEFSYCYWMSYKKYQKLMQ